MSALSTIPITACSMELPCDIHAVAELGQTARAFLSQAGLQSSDLDAWELILAEAANNAVKYCRPEARSLPIRVDINVTTVWAEIRVHDRTAGFDWPEKAELPPFDSESGRGVFLIQNLSDESQYLRGRGENCLVIRKRLPRLSQGAPVEKANVEEQLREARHTLDLMTEELASSYESLSAIFRFTAELQSGVDPREFIPRWLRELLTITESDWFLLRLVDPASRQLCLVCASEPGVDEGLAANGETSGEGAPAENRAIVLRCDVWFDLASPLAQDDPLARLAKGGCGFVHPIFANDTRVGVLSIGRLDPNRSFEAGQVNVIQTFADFLGLQIRSNQLHEEQVRARVNMRDLEIAANLQRGLLPATLPALPSVSLSGFYRSAREIGGDYYDAFRLGEGSLACVIADVMGKGLPAALFAGMFRSLVRARRDLASQPGVFLAWLNQRLFEELDRAEMFITAQIVFLDWDRKTIRVASAGHPPFLMANAAGEITEIPASGPPLGIDSEATFVTDHQSWSGALALMFTDGLTEARNVNDELLGLDMVKSWLAGAARDGDGSDAAQQRFAAQLQTFEQGAPAGDDTAFLIISGEPASKHG